MWLLEGRRGVPGLDWDSPRMERKCPSSVCRTTFLMSCTFLPRNCSQATARSSFSVMIFTCRAQRHLSQAGGRQRSPRPRGVEEGGCAPLLLFQTWRPRGLEGAESEASSVEST